MVGAYLRLVCIHLIGDEHGEISERALTKFDMFDEHGYAALRRNMSTGKPVNRGEGYPNQPHVPLRRVACKQCQLLPACSPDLPNR